MGENNIEEQAIKEGEEYQKELDEVIRKEKEEKEREKSEAFKLPEFVKVGGEKVKLEDFIRDFNNFFRKGTDEEYGEFQKNANLKRIIFSKEPTLSSGQRYKIGEFGSFFLLEVEGQYFILPHRCTKAYNLKTTFKLRGADKDSEIIDGFIPTNLFKLASCKKINEIEWELEEKGDLEVGKWW